jgi:hypothetical protein
MQAIAAENIEGTIWMVIIIEDDWLLSTFPNRLPERALRFVLRRMRSVVRQRLRGVPYLLQSDLAVRRHVYDHKLCVEVHWHGLFWATASQIKSLKKRFSASRFGADGLDAEEVYDLTGALSYNTRDTRLGCAIVRNLTFRPGLRHR